MPLLYWSLRDIQQSTIADGFTIVTKTDVVCHQWLRHTLMPPQKHPKPVFRRGLLMMYDARFCFVAYEDLEQDEPGDTLTHTFTWTGWTECETRYFYFWATNAGEKMKSTSPIFSKHFIAPKIFTAYGKTSDFDGYSGWKQTYPVFHAAPGTRCRNTYNTVFAIQARGRDPYWYGYRSALVFDTAGLDPGWTITKIEIHFMPHILYLPGSGNLCFIDGTGASLACDPTAFSVLLPFTSILAEAAHADLAAWVWAMVEVAPSGFGVLNPGGDTIIVIREKDERNVDPDGVPADGTHGYGIFSADEPGREPYLVIYGE